MKNKVVLCITGASGFQYGYRTLQVLSDLSFHVDLILSNAALRVMREETHLKKEDLLAFDNVTLLPEKDIGSHVASGSRLIEYRGVIVAPCSMSTLACIAKGVNQNLIHRVCEVALKEKVPLVLLIREMPYSVIHLRNMLEIASAGATVMSASPGFYHKPKTIEDMLDFVVGKVLDTLRIEHYLYKRWKKRDDSHNPSSK